MHLNFEWSQDSTSLTIKLPLRRIDTSKINVSFFENYVKVNIPERSIIKLIDLFEEIEFQKSNWVFQENQLILNIQKKKPGFWDSAEVQGLGKQELKKRRDKATIDKHNYDQTKDSQTNELKNKVQKNAVEEKYEHEKKVKQQIEEKKKQDKENALNSIFNKPISNPSQICQDLSNPEIMAQNNPNQIIMEQIDYHLFEQNNGTILTQNELKTLQQKAKRFTEEEVGTPRICPFVQLSFTKKVYANLAAREQQLNSPPMPSGSKQTQKTDGQDYMWYKEKADLFLKNQDLSSAVNAYQESLRLNSEHVETLLNLSVALIKQLRLSEASNLINSALCLLEKRNLDAEINDLLLNSLSKKAWIETQLGNLEEAKSLLNKLNGLLAAKIDNRSSIEITHEMSGDLNCCVEKYQKYRELVLENIDRINKRIFSDQIKKQADELTSQSLFQDAVFIYEKVLIDDPQNEKALANLGFVFIKLGNTKSALICINQSLEISLNSTTIYNLKSETVNRESEHFKFLVKLFARKSDCLEILGDLNAAELTIKDARKFDENSEFLLAKLKAIRIKQNKVSFENLRSEFHVCLKLNDHQSALLLSNKMDEFLEIERDVIDVLKNSGNRVVCLLKLEKFDNVVAECLRAGKIIANLKSNFLSKVFQENKTLIGDLEQKCLMRKAFAFNQLGQIYNAKKDVEKVLELNPDHEEAKGILDNFKLVVC